MARFVWRVAGVLALAGATGCSGQQGYLAWQQARLQECGRLPVPQQAHCKSLYDLPYEDYRRQRQEIIDENPQGARTL